MTFPDRQHVAEYERRRYRSPDQKLVNRREQVVVQEIIRTLGLTKAHVLDVPCGYGRFSTVFASRGAEVICADVSPAMVGRARDQIHEQRNTARFVVMDIRHLPFRDDAVDVTFTIRLFHHRFAREQMSQILRELARVSRRWVVLSYYRPSLVHSLTRRARRLSSQISMIPTKELKAELSQTPLIVRTSRHLIPFLHAQTMLVLEKPRSAQT
jgi:ubiquinone/menaquinone biosynthesis C-methylase UbiE